MSALINTAVVIYQRQILLPGNILLKVLSESEDPKAGFGLSVKLSILHGFYVSQRDDEKAGFISRGLSQIDYCCNCNCKLKL